MDLKIKSSSEYKEMSLEETLKFLETSLEVLSKEEADNRIKKFGYNEILEIKKNSLLAFFKNTGDRCHGYWNSQ